MKINLLPKEELEAKIKEFQDAYYNTGESLVSDAEFDDYYDTLMEIDPNNEVFRRVGSDSGSAFKKVKHFMYCGSQNKCNEPEEFIDWINKRAIGKDVLVEYKCDGSSIELQYENGKFARAVSRGNGSIGDDVTENISKAQHVVNILKDPNFTGGVRGEVLLFHKDFEKAPFGANCRNAANGIMKRKNSEYAYLLSVVVYDVYNAHDPEWFKKESDKIEWLKDQQFKCVETYYMPALRTHDEITKLRDELSTNRFSTVEYDIDGLVIKVNDIDFNDMNKTKPDNQIAYKFILSEQPSDLLNVEFSRNGKTYTPVGVFTPVYLCGTTVQRANLCNPNIINSLGIKIGSKIMIVKRGEIIPKIKSVISNPPNAKDIVYPEICECCGSKLKITPSKIYCPNKSCPSTVIHRLLKWVTINNIYGIGESLAKALYDAKIISDVKDLYTVSVDELSKVMSPKIAVKIKANIDKSKSKMNLVDFIAGYDLDDIGRLMIEKVITVKKIKDIWGLLNLRVEDIETIPGFAVLASENLVNELSYYKNELVELSKLFDFKSDETVIRTDSRLSNKSVAFTGALNTMTRDEAIAKLKSVGGSFSSSVTSNTDYLCTNETDSANSKFVKAKQLGIPIITEEQFNEMIK